VGVVTCADADLIAQIPTYLPDIALHVRPSAQTTTFANYYHEGFRTQYLHARGEPLQSSDVPEAWQHTPIVLLGPWRRSWPPTL